MHPVIIQDVRVLVSNHLRLCMTGVSLNGFDVAAVQFQLIGDTGVAQTVKNHLRQIVSLD